MSDQLEITDGKGRRRSVQVGRASFVFGSGAGADLRVEAEGVEASHLRFVRTGTGVRVEPARPGGTVQVNGEELFCKDLRRDDVVAAGSLQLRWLPAAPVVPAGALRRAVPGGDPRTGQGARPARPPRRPRGMPAIVPIAGLFLLVLVVVLLVLRHLAGSTWPSSPEHYVELARAQLANQEPQRALDTLTFALREATGATRSEAQQLEADIRRLQFELAGMPKVNTARAEHDVLMGYVGRHLREPVERPAAREFVRLCDQWLERHREVCAGHGDGRPLLAAVEAERSRFAAAAELGQPDTPADVIFAARARLVFQWRDYKGAIARIDRYLAAGGDAAEVRAERAAIVSEGEKWVRGKLETLDYLLGRDDRDNAAKDLAQLERWSLLPEWEPLLAPYKQRLAR